MPRNEKFPFFNFFIFFFHFFHLAEVEEHLRHFEEIKFSHIFNTQIETTFVVLSTSLLLSSRFLYPRARERERECVCACAFVGVQLLFYARSFSLNGL